MNRHSGNTLFGSHILNDTTPSDGNVEYWRSLYYYNIYRFSLAIFLVTASLSPLNVGSLGSNNNLLFSIISILYAVLAIVYGILIHQNLARYVVICRLSFISDAILIITMIYASGGLGSGLESLLIISVAASGILMGGRSAMATASLITLLLLSEHLIVILNEERKFGGFTAMGFMGLGLFITAFLIYFLTVKLRVREHQVVQQQLDIKNLDQLNKYIIHKLHFGLIVVDQQLNVVFVSEHAQKLLGMNKNITLPEDLSVILPAFSSAAADWLNYQGKSEILVTTDDNKILLARFQTFDDQGSNLRFIIVIDDQSKIEKNRQNDKLVAMGRLTASIAHEIRNPLGAISHAAQLLEESSGLGIEDIHLVDIIGKQSRRINSIIETILELGRTTNTKLEKLSVYEWLSSVIQDFTTEKGLEKGGIQLQGDIDIEACLNQENMRQVIFNLLQNAIQHANLDRKPLATLTIAYDSSNELPEIHIADSGTGVPKVLTERIFEPFFTTSSSGNGLGLYIAKQICIGNRGSLGYVQNNSTDGHFKVTLAPAHLCGELDKIQ